MTAAEINRKLNQLTEIANELHKEAQRRFGPDAHLFYESEGTFHIMKGESMGRTECSHRQKFIAFSSEGRCHMEAGAW